MPESPPQTHPQTELAAEAEAPLGGAFSHLLLRAAPIIAALVAGYVGMNYVLNAFYVQGHLVADAGWFAGMVWHNDWRMQHPIAVRDFIRLWTDDFYDIHLSPLTIAATYLSYLTPLEAPEWFSLYMGVGAGVVALCFALACRDFLRFHAPKMFESKFKLAACAAIGGAVFGLNPATANLLVYPHIEIYIPAFILLFLMALAANRRKTALLVLLAALSTRGDAGLHLCMLLWTAAAYLCLRDMRKGKTLRAVITRHRVLLWWSAPAIVYSVFAMSLFGRASPVEWDLLPDAGELGARIAEVALRLEFLFLFLFVPLASWYCRRRDWMIGVVSVIPWVALGLLSFNEYFGYLRAYYSFPFIFVMFWPLISHRFVIMQVHAAPLLNQQKRKRRPRAALAAMFVLAFAAVSVIRPMHEQSTVRSALSPLINQGMKPPPVETVSSVHAFGEFYKQNRRRVMVDDTFSSLYPHDVPAIKELGLNNDRVLACNGDIMIVNQSHLGLIGNSIYAAAHAFGINHWYSLLHTGYLVGSARPMCENGACANNLPLAEIDFSGWLRQRAEDAHEMQMTWDGCALGALGPAEDVEAGIGALEDTSDDKSLYVDSGPTGVVAVLTTPPLRGKRFFDIYYSYENDNPDPPLIMQIQGGEQPLLVRLPLRPQTAQGGVGIVYDPGATETPTAATVRLQYPGSGKFRLRRIQTRPAP